MTREEAIKFLKNVYCPDCEDKKCDMCWYGFAIADMEKQIPKVVINKDDFSDYAECPSCNGIATDSVGCVYKWCRECGQRLKWREEDD